MADNVLVILGHPDSRSFCGAIADAYASGADAAGKNIRVLRLGELRFDPVLWNGYGRIQELEPDLVQAQELIVWADHLVFVYPVWWGVMPALLKGFFDRALLPGFGFTFREYSPFWDKLLTGRTAHLMVTMDTPPWYYRWVYRMPGHNAMVRTILGFCGIRTRKVSEFGPIKTSSTKEREKWLDRARQAGSNA
jgi:putative NADPH-quinone reductase